MIPWFIVNAVSAILRPFGFQVVVRATQGRFGADRMYVHRADRPFFTEIKG